MGRQQKISPAHRTEAGFTLVELLVVMVIMALAYSLAAPMVSTGVAGTELKAAARKLAAGLRKARSEAIAQRRETLLTVDVENRKFQIGDDKRIYQLPSSIGIKLFTAQSELVSESTGSIRFFSDGGSTGGRISLAARDRIFEVDVNWLTGQIAVLE